MKFLPLLIVTVFMLGVAISFTSMANEDQPNATSNKVKIDEELSDLSLNNGKKWQMDEHTRKSFLSMEKLFSDIDVNNLSKENLKKYGSDLRADINTLIQGCEMQGDAHDQLHTFLMPYIDIVDHLSENGEIEEAIKIQRYLKTYKEFFE